MNQNICSHLAQFSSRSGDAAGDGRQPGEGMVVEVARNDIDRYPWLEERADDLVRNFLYQAFIEQLVSRPDAIRSYADWAVGIGARAVAMLLVSRPHGGEALREWHPAGMPLPDREVLRHLLEMTDGSDIRAWLALAFQGIPGLFEATETLLLSYAALVRTEWARLDRARRRHPDTPLPDDIEVGPILPRLDIPLEVRIERAVEAIECREGNYKVIATRYRVGQKRLLRVLHERGLNRPRGGRA